MAVLQPLSKVLPGIRGASTLDDMFLKHDQQHLEVGDPSRVYVFPPHVIVLTDEGHNVLGFDAVTSEHRSAGRSIHDNLSSQLKHQPDSNALSSTELHFGLLCFWTPSAIISVISASQTDELFYLVQRDRFVRAARFDLLQGKWSLNPEQDFHLGEPSDTYEVLDVQFCASRSTFIWIAKFDDGSYSLMFQQYSTIMGLSTAQTLMYDIPPCDLYLCGDLVCLNAKNARREIYMWPLGTLKMMAFFYGVGQLDVSPEDQEVRHFKIALRRLMLPARLESSRCGIEMPIVGTAQHPLNEHLLLIDGAGVVTELHVQDLKIISNEICRVKQSKKAIFEDVAMLIHHGYLLLSDSKKCMMYLLADGSECGDVIQTGPNLRVWQGTTLSGTLAGIWSPGEGAWFVECNPILEQAKYIATHVPNGSDVAANFCSEWNIPRAAGKFALDALLKFGSADRKDGRDFNYVVSECTKMMAHVRLVERSPLLLLAILGQNPHLHEILQDEIQMYGVDSESSESLESTRSNSHNFEDAVENMIMKYSKLSTAYRNTLLDWVPEHNLDNEPITRVRDRISELLDSSKTVTLGDDSSIRIAYEFSNFVEKAPADVLDCILKHLNLLSAIEVGFPNIANFSQHEDSKTVKFMLFENPRLDWTTQLFEDSTCRICLFEILCRLLLQVKPERVVQFIDFAAGVYFNGSPKKLEKQQMFIRAAECLKSFAEKSSSLRKNAVRPLSIILKYAGQRVHALKTLIGANMWDESIMDVKQAEDSKSLHRQLFVVLMEGLHSAGKLNTYSDRVFNTEFVPALYRIEDLFQLFQDNGGTKTCSPISKVDSSETRVSSLRTPILTMLKQIKSKDQQ